MNISEILGTGLVAGLVVQFVQIGRDYFGNLSRRQKLAKRQAFQLSNELMILCIACQDSLSQYQVQEPDPEREGRVPPQLPEFDFSKYSEALTDLEESDLAILADVEFRTQVEASFIRAGFLLWLEPEDVEKLQVERVQSLMEESGKMARLVRERHNLPPFGDFERLIRNE